MSLTEKLINNYEAHLEANWTREGERMVFGRVLPVICGVPDEVIAKWRTTTLHIGQDFHHESIPTAGAKKTLS